MKNKRGDVTSDKTINWILVLVVLLIVLSGLIYFFKGTIFIWIKNLPGYSQQQGDQLVTSFTKDQLRALNCNVFVGRVNGEQILKCAKPASTSCDNPSYQRFYLDGNVIYFDDGSILSKDPLIGSIKNSQIDIDNNVFYNSEKNSVILNLRSDLRYLDGAQILNVNNIICRSDSIEILAKGYIIRKSEIPKDWKIISSEQSVPLSDTVINIYVPYYNKYKPNFDSASSKYHGSLNQVEFTALLVAVSHVESGVGTLTQTAKDIDYFMGYEQKGLSNSELLGVDNQLNLAAQFLSNNFKSCNVGSDFDSASINCLVSKYGDVTGLDNSLVPYVLNYYSSWLKFLSEGTVNLNSETSINYEDSYGFTISTITQGANLKVLSLTDPSDNSEVDFIYFEKTKPNDLFVK
ncbi:MAG: hypothetical protein AABX48_02675 [Nanoarchaeota archaeon]